MQILNSLLFNTKYKKVITSASSFILIINSTFIFIILYIIFRKYSLITKVIIILSFRKIPLILISITLYKHSFKEGGLGQPLKPLYILA
jgi:hypothetical protein